MKVCFDFTEPSEWETLSDTALLELCRGELENASVTDVSGLIRMHTADGMSCLQKLRERAERTTTLIRLPSSIFVGQQDRADAYRTVCEALVFLEPLWSELYAVFVAFSDLEVSLQSIESALQRAEALAETYAKRQTAEQNRVRETEMKIKKRSACLKNCKTEFLKNRDVLRRVCFEIASDFAERVSKIADMEHDGAFCDPQGAVRLFAELRDAAGNAERSIGTVLKGGV